MPATRPIVQIFCAFDPNAQIKPKKSQNGKSNISSYLGLRFVVRFKISALHLGTTRKYIISGFESVPQNQLAKIRHCPSNFGNPKHTGCWREIETMPKGLIYKYTWYTLLPLLRMGHGSTNYQSHTSTSLIPHHSHGTWSIADHHHREVLRIQAFGLVSHVPRILPFAFSARMMNERDKKEWSQDIMWSPYGLEHKLLISPLSSFQKTCFLHAFNSRRWIKRNLSSRYYWKVGSQQNEVSYWCKCTSHSTLS